MPLHLTRIAFGSPTLDHFAQRLQLRAVGGVVEVVTRYLPKRHAEIAAADTGDAGSLYWILKHQLVARTPILGFGEAPDGKCAIRIDPGLVLVETRHKRAHQGWRYLEPGDAPPDLGGGAADGLGALPPGLQSRLADLALI